MNLINTVTTETDAVALFGEGSMLASMWRSAKANADLGLPIDVIAIAPGAGVAATSAVVVSMTGGTLGSNGEVPLWIGNQRISVGAVSTDTPTTLAAKIAAAVNAAVKLPVTAAAAVATVTLTCRWVGLSGNDISVVSQFYQDDKLPAGLTLTIPAMSGGTVSPDVTPVIVAMAGNRYTEIVCPFTDSTNLGLLEAEMYTRWLQNNMQDGAIVNAIRGTEGANTTFLNARNSAHVHTIVTTKDITSPWDTAAMAGALIESMAAIDPALPHTGALLVGYLGPRVGDDFIVDQKNNMLLAGGSPLEIRPDGTGGLLRMVTNYKKTAAGVPDRSMSELCWIKTMSYIRWMVVTEFQTKYRGYKILQYATDPQPGQKIMTKELGQEVMLGLYKQFTDVTLCQNPAYYQQTLVVEIDGPNGKLKIRDEPVIVTQHYQTEVTSAVVAGQV
ncbi:MAG: phage tail protein [Pseudomonadota bacterium]